MYIFHNRARMRYPKFHAQGLCTSTGVLEAGCKVVIAARLKRAGMHWIGWQYRLGDRIHVVSGCRPSKSEMETLRPIGHLPFADSE